MELIEKLFSIQKRLLHTTKVLQARPFLENIAWKDRLIGLVGAKGVGKTTLMLQRLAALTDGLYCSLDAPWAQACPIYDLAEQFYLEGGRTLFLDEAHKYPDWSSHIKGVYDSFPELNIVFSGSSALHLHQGQGDLSRRVSLYHIPALSFREYLQFETGKAFTAYSLEEILKNHTLITSAEEFTRLQPLKYFKKYLEGGIYPFYLEGEAHYLNKVVNAANQAIESDLVVINNLEGRYVSKLKKLLYVLATAVPYSPNMVELSGAIEISRPSLYQYLEFLEQAELIHLVRALGKGNSILTKAEKIYLNNSNLLYALGKNKSKVGTIRETFFVHQLRAANALVEIPARGDFFVDNHWTFEVGGKGKSFDQIKELENAFVVSDNIETGFKHRIPLWLFGFLY